MPNNPAAASLDDLTVFLAVTRAGGFRQAARALGTSASTVSETVSRLEASMGVRLFTRTTRSTRLTEAGEVLARRIGPILSEARAAMDEAASSGTILRGRLKLNVPGAVMHDILPPLLERFLARHPGLRAEVVVDDRLVDATASGADAGIRYGEHLAQDMIAVPIGPRQQQAALAASPDYLARSGRPGHPGEVLDHDCIRLRFAGGALSEWTFEKDGESISLDPQARLVLTTAAAHAGIGHAVAGMGLIYTFRNWLEPQFASGALVPVLQDWWPAFEGPWLYFSSRFMPAPLRAFVDFVAEEQRQT